MNPVVTTLPNGLKLLVQRVASNPTVFVRGVVRTSPTYDPAGKEGLGAITSGLMNWGSAKYDYGAQRKLVGQVVADSERRILAINPAWTAMLGWSEGDLLGKTTERLLHPDDREKTRAESARLAEGQALGQRPREDSGDGRIRTGRAG